MKKSTNDKIVYFVDKYITCQNDKSSEIEDCESTVIAQRILQWIYIIIKAWTIGEKQDCTLIYTH